MANLILKGSQQAVAAIPSGSNYVEIEVPEVFAALDLRLLAAIPPE